MSTMSVSYKLKILKDGASIPFWGTDWARETITATLQAGIQLTVPLPPNRYTTAIFAYAIGTNVFVKPVDGINIVIPAPGAFTTQIAELNPTARNIEGDTGLYLISDTTSFVSISLFNR